MEAGSCYFHCPLDKMLPAYYRPRGWDERGIPTDKKLKRLEII